VREGKVAKIVLGDSLEHSAYFWNVRNPVHLSVLVQRIYVQPASYRAPPLLKSCHVELRGFKPKPSPSYQIAIHDLLNSVEGGSHSRAWKKSYSYPSRFRGARYGSLEYALQRGFVGRGASGLFQQR
jgi:hypothetical protein